MSTTRSAKKFSIIVGSILTLVGVGNFFIPAANTFHVSLAHAILHIVAGAFGVIFSRFGRGYALWTGMIGLALALMGFAGINTLGNITDLPAVFNYFHALLGLIGLLVYVDIRNTSASTPTQS